MNSFIIKNAIRAGSNQSINFISFCVKLMTGSVINTKQIHMINKIYLTDFSVALGTDS